jgi:hypothetical protein
MDLRQVFDFLEGQENGEAMVAAISTKITALNNEAAQWRVKLRESASELVRIQELSGGDSQALEGKLTALTQQLKAAQVEIDTAKTSQADSIAKEAGLRKTLILQDVAVRAGADRTALTEILQNIEPDKIVISENGITVDGKPLTEFAQAKGDWAVRALFPTAPKPTLPTGGTSGQAPKNPVEDYFRQTYTLPKAKTNAPS